MKKRLSQNSLLRIKRRQFIFSKQEFNEFYATVEFLKLFSFAHGTLIWRMIVITG